MSDEQVCHCGSLTHSRGECSSVRKCHSCGEVAVNEVGAAIMDERDRYRAALEKIERISERWAFQSDDRGLVHGTAQDAIKGEPRWCGCGDALEPNEIEMCGRCAS